MARKPSLKEAFAALDANVTISERYGRRLQELDEKSMECIETLGKAGNIAVDYADASWKAGATPQVLQDTDSTVIHIRRAKEAVDNLPALCSRAR